LSSNVADDASSVKLDLSDPSPTTPLVVAGGLEALIEAVEIAVEDATLVVVKEAVDIIGVTLVDARTSPDETYPSSATPARPRALAVQRRKDGVLTGVVDVQRATIGCPGWYVSPEIGLTQVTSNPDDAGTART
jgi:hypothetical protein